MRIQRNKRKRKTEHLHTNSVQEQTKLVPCENGSNQGQNQRAGALAVRRKKAWISSSVLRSRPKPSLKRRAVQSATLSAVVVAALTPAVRSALIGRGVFDVSTERSSHKGKIPRGGGIACAVGIGIATMTNSAPEDRGALLLPGALAATGLIDDIANLPPGARLGVQVIAGSIAGRRYGNQKRGIVIGALATPLLVNSVNFMDGINGISGATFLTWGVSASLQGLRTGKEFATIAAATAGACLGFLPYNARTASIFLGDSGSYLLGGVAAESLRMTDSIRDPNVLLTIAPLGPYLADVATTIGVRLHQGKNVLEPHREHGYQKLVHIGGWSHSKVALLAGMSAAICAVAAQTMKPRVSLPAIISVSCAFALIPRHLFRDGRN